MPKPSATLLAEGFFEFKKQSSNGHCWVKGCQRASRHDRSLCHMHEMRRWRALKKKTADYCTLRDHAQARKIKFEITLDYWRGLVDAFGFYNKEDDDLVLSIDRVDATRGYVEGNMRVVTINLNSYKANKEKYLPEHVQHMLERKREQLREEQKKHLAMDNEDPEEWDDIDQSPNLLLDEIDDDNCPF